jgi:O-methyltransferase
MQMAASGADVVVFDLPRGKAPDLLPIPGRDMASVRAETAAGIERVLKSWWYFRRAFKWQAGVVYGDIYRLPDDLGRFDVTLLGAILLHLRDPFRAIQQVAAITDRTIVVTDLLQREFGGNSYLEFCPHPELNHAMGWWYISPGAISRMLRIVGFEPVRLTTHSHNFHASLEADKFSTLEFFTVVAERIGGPYQRPLWARRWTRQTCEPKACVGSRFIA